jgi:trans-aconitate 2-methyltransferase
LSTVKLPTKIDVIFSNATIHWILDHRTLFENFWSLLNDEGEMIIQCGGLGNLDKVINLIDEVKHSPTFCNFFALWKKTWNFPTPGETSRILEQIGFKDVNVNLVNEPVAFPDRNNFGLFARTVIMKPYLAILPSAGLQNMFIDSVLDKIEQQNNGEPWVIDYVRLNIKAKKN